VAEEPEGKQVRGASKHQNVNWQKLRPDWTEILPENGKLVQLETPIKEEIIKKTRNIRKKSKQIRLA
jgi:hypothetical protein